MQIHEKAKPFVEWLKQAEEEESDDDKSDISIEYNDRPSVATQKPKENSQKASNDTGINDENDDDLNIDDI